MKNKLMILIATSILTSCGRDGTRVELIPGPKGDQGQAGSNGSDGADGAQGEQGVPGNDGANGADGLNSLVKIYRTNSIDPLICASGSGIAVESGLDVDGSNVLDALEVQSLNFVCDGEVGAVGATGAIGAQGPQGEQGEMGPTSPNSIATVIDPCGDHPTKHDEVILQLENGLLLASFSDNANGLNTRFSLLGNGTYGTTDGTSCTFTVSSGVVSW